jgi:hypothetical protein
MAGYSPDSPTDVGGDIDTPEKRCNANPENPAFWDLNGNRVFI